MNTIVLKFIAVCALAGCIVAAIAAQNVLRQPLLRPEARPILAWTPDLDAYPLASSKENAPVPHDELLARPIFAPARRPFVPPPPALVEPPPQPVVEVLAPPPAPEPVLAAAPPPQLLIDPQQFQLKGIIETGMKKSALIATPQNSEGAWQDAMSDVMGWKMVRIERNSVVLEGDGREFILQQYADSPQQDPPNDTVGTLGASPGSGASTVN